MSSNENDQPKPALQDGGVPTTDYNIVALFVIMPTHYLKIGNMCYETNTFKIHPKGMAALKNASVNAA